MKTSRINGISLVEVLVVVSLIAVGVTLAVPSWNDARTKRELVSASEELSGFLSVGRSLAIKHNRDVAVGLVYQDSTHWCIGMIDSGSACDCTVADVNSEAYCAVRGVPQVLHSADVARASLASHSKDTSFVFDRVRGTLISADAAYPHYFNLASASGQAGLQVGISATGGTFICNWLQSADLSAYRSCEPATRGPDSPTYEGTLLAN